MNIIIKSAEVECRGSRAKSRIRQPPLRAYMDDITVSTSSVIGCQWIVRALEKLIVWARRRFKQGKSRPLVLQKGKIKSTARFTIVGEFIATVTEKPVKSLGKWFYTKDQAAIKGIGGDLDDWLRKIDKSGLPGMFKAWLYQHAILPRILWPLMLYEVAITTVEGMERKISGYLRRWLGLPKSLSSAALYETTNAIQLPFRGFKVEFVVTRTREAILYRNSKGIRSRYWNPHRKEVERCQGTEGCGREVAAEGYGRYRGQKDKRPGILSESQDRQRQRERKKGALTKRSKRRHGRD